MKTFTTNLQLTSAFMLCVCMLISKTSNGQSDSTENSLSPSSGIESYDQEPKQAPRLLKPVYFGYEVSFAMQQHSLRSSVQKLNNLAVSELGVRVGAKLSSARAGLKGYGGIYYSGGDVPYSIDMLDAGIVGSLYFLRLRKIAYHSLEPYAVAGMAYQGARFYGSYLNDVMTNNSVGEGPFLGNVSWLQAMGGIGVEYQFESANLNFMHFFAEVRFGVPFLFHASIDEFSETQTSNATSLSFGVSFGKFKNLRHHQ